jgi:MFS family permease
MADRGVGDTTMDTMTPASPATEPERLISGPFLSVMATAGVFFVYIGMMVTTIPSFIERELDGGEFGVGLAMASFAAAAIFARPFLGRLTERHGRRKLIMSGAALAAVATVLTAFATELWHVLVLRSFMGLGEAALFVASATLIADLSPPHRRAEAASYFSVAVFGGIGIGPIIAESMTGNDQYGRVFVIAGVFAALSVVVTLGVPARVDRSSAPAAEGRQLLFHRAAFWPGVVLASGIAAFAVFMAFIPEYSKTVGLSGAGGLFLVYSAVSITLRLTAAKLPERLGEHRTVTIAFVGLMSALVLVAAVPEAWALWAGAAIIGFGMAFMYPSLMANVVNRVRDDERAIALSSLTMFFEVGTIVGGVALGGIGEIFSKRAGFLGGAVIAAFGLVVLWQFLVAADVQPDGDSAGAAGPAVGPAIAGS